MSLRKLLLPMLALGALAACDKNTGGTPTNIGPLAYYRFVNAVPDTVALDFRFVDAVDNSNPFINIPYRSFTPYQGTTPGTRNVTIFTDPTGFPDTLTAQIAQQVILTGSVTLTAGTYHTIVVAGNARTPGDPRFFTIVDALPTPTAGNIALRTLHAARNLPASVDAYVLPETTPQPVATAATSAALAFGTAGTYGTFATRPINALANTSTYRWDIFAAGAATSTTPAASVIANGTIRTGIQGTTTVNPNAGIQVDQSVITAIVFGPSIPTVAPTPALLGNRPLIATNSVQFLPDKNPPRTAP